MRKNKCKLNYAPGVMKGLFILSLLLFCSQLSWTQVNNYPFKFHDVAKESGLFPAAEGIYGHGAGWGDVDGDGWIDLYVGTFHKAGYKPNMFFKNNKGKFIIDKQPPLEISSRTTGVAFADLDNDGDPDLYISSMPHDVDSSYLIQIQGCHLYRNDGNGKFTDISENNGACPLFFGGRSATVLDYDGDGLLDILAGEDPMTGYNGSKTRSSRLFHNKGHLQFEDVSQKVGLPEGIPGYGVAAADFNNDSWPDFFLSANDGGGVLFLNDKHGKFYELPGSRELFYWKGSGGSNQNNMVCGVAYGDVNRDGLLDIVLGPHFQLPWLEPQSLRLFLNKGIKNGIPKYEEITAKSGLQPLPMKAPHVEIDDFDNDGWPDIYASIVKFKDGQPYPSIARNLGINNSIPVFRDDAMKVNDFPTDKDKEIKKSDPLFKKVIREKTIIYTAPGPSGDYDNDGKVDMFLASWWPEAPSMLLHNETLGGNWLQIQVNGRNGVNSNGVGSKIKIYKSGQLNNKNALLGCQDVGVAYGYASGHQPLVHFGLGTEMNVDIEVILPNEKGTVIKKNVKANERLTISND